MLCPHVATRGRRAPPTPGEQPPRGAPSDRGGNASWRNRTAQEWTGGRWWGLNRSRAELYYVGDQLLATEEAMGPETGVAGPRDTQPARGRASSPPWSRLTGLKTVYHCWHTLGLASAGIPETDCKEETALGWAGVGGGECGAGGMQVDLTTAKATIVLEGTSYNRGSPAVVLGYSSSDRCGSTTVGVGAPGCGLAALPT